MQKLIQTPTLGEVCFYHRLLQNCAFQMVGLLTIFYDLNNGLPLLIKNGTHEVLIPHSLCQMDGLLPRKKKVVMEVLSDLILIMFKR